MKGRKQINVKQANRLSCEAIDPYLKNLTFSIRLIHFNRQSLHALLTNELSLKYNQNGRLPSFLRYKLKLLSK